MKSELNKSSFTVVNRKLNGMSHWKWWVSKIKKIIDYLRWVYDKSVKFGEQKEVSTVNAYMCVQVGKEVKKICHKVRTY